MQIKVLSRNAKLYSTKRLVEAARARNHEVSVINPLNCDLVIKKRDLNVFYKGKKIENVDAIIPRIGISDTFYGAAVIRQFELMKVFSTVGSLALNRSRDRLRTLQLLSSANLGLPETAISNDSNNLSGILSFVDNAPLIIKLLE
ncbi:MAG: 30S ribosomal protein S6--L-glutamate ligase, partial [Gillisia sp.]